MKLRIAISLMAAVALMGCGEDTTAGLTAEDPIDTTKTVTTVVEKDTTVVDPKTGEEVTITVKDTVETEVKVDPKDEPKETDPKDDKPKDTGTTDPKDTDPKETGGANISLDESLEYKILDSDEVGLESYADYVNDMDLKLIPTKNRVFVMGASEHFAGQIPSLYSVESDSISETTTMPSHLVKFTKNIYMKRTEVTCKEFADVLNKNMTGVTIHTKDASNGGYYSRLSYAGKEIYSDAGSTTKSGYDFSDSKEELQIVGSSSKFVANNITWHGAAFFCNKLSKMNGLEEVYDVSNDWKADMSKNGFRLPTEAEWEYAARAGSDTPFFWGGIDKLEEASYYVRSDYGNVGGTMPSSFSLQGMIGNVEEWVNDLYAPYSADKQIDPVGPSIDEIDVVDNRVEYVVRGAGGKNANGTNLLSTTRYPQSRLAAWRGFRYVLPVMD